MNKLENRNMLIPHLQKEANPMNRSERLRKLREDLHLSQVYVAKHLGISLSSFNELENTRRSLDTDELAKISDLYGVTSVYILNGESLSDKRSHGFPIFEPLSKNDQEEIMNTLRFKKRLKAKLKDK